MKTVEFADLIDESSKRSVKCRIDPAENPNLRPDERNHTVFDQIMAAMSKPTTQNPFDYAQRMMECTLRLTQAQMDVMKGLYAEVGQEYAASLASADPAAMLKSWPQLAATTIRAQAETGALLMKNAHKFQTELLEIRQSANPGLSGQIMKDMMEIVRTNGSTRPPVRAKKAA